jgi:thioredoxin
MLEHLTKDTFLQKIFDYENKEEWEYQGELPAIIDFYADWCAPCRIVAPILEELAEEYKDKIVIYKVDTEEEQELAAVFGIKSIPSILFIPKNDKPQMAVGVLPKETFKEIIEDILLKETPLN